MSTLPAKYYPAYQFIMESNAIENVCRHPTEAECIEHIRFLKLIAPSIQDLEQFVSVYEPGAKLRTMSGANVRVGGRTCPVGGPAVGYALEELLWDAKHSQDTPFEIHLRYELLHPFTDCNGRSGRMLWAWQIYYNSDRKHSPAEFLRLWYYESLRRASYGQ